MSPSTSKGLVESPELVIAEALTPPSAPVKACRFDTAPAALGNNAPILKSTWRESWNSVDATTDTTLIANRLRFWYLILLFSQM